MNHERMMFLSDICINIRSPFSARCILLVPSLPIHSKECSQGTPPTSRFVNILLVPFRHRYPSIPRIPPPRHLEMQSSGNDVYIFSCDPCPPPVNVSLPPGVSLQRQQNSYINSFLLSLFCTPVILFPYGLCTALGNIKTQYERLLCCV